MRNPQKILIVITREKPVQSALERAFLFARSNHIELTLYSAVYEPALELTAILAPDERKMLKQQYLEARQNYLDELCQQHSKTGFTLKSKVVWHKKLSHAVVEYTQDNEFDLTIKSISSDASSKNPFIMPTDWHLLRFCKSPLLLVRDEEWKSQGAVLGAVNPTSDCPDHLKLNHKVIEYTQYLSELLGCEAHAINTHVSPTLEMPSDYPSLEHLRQKVTQIHTEKMQELMSQHPFKEQHIHVVEGLPQDKIPATAQKIGAQLVVMGTVGRTGLTAAFIGNTAERVLSRLQCEVLALKPDNFEI